MKILYLVDYPIAFRGGAMISTRILGELLEKKYGVEVYYCSPFDYMYKSDIDKKRLLEINLSQRNFATPYRHPIDFILSSKKIRSFISDIDPDIIHSQMPVSLLINSSLKIDYDILKFHTDRGLYKGYRLPMKILNNRAVRNLDCLITTTEINANQWRRIANNHIEVIPNTVLESFNDYDPTRREKMRERYCLNDSPVIGFAGRMIDLKNWPLVLDIAKQIKKLRDDFRIALALSIYSGSDEESLAKEFIENMKAIMGNQLVYFKNLTQEEMADFYYLVDIFVLTSKFESFGRTAVEAMSRKNCVLGTSVGGIPEVIGDTELLCDQQVQCFVDKIILLMDNKNLLLDKQNTLFKRYKNNFSCETVVLKQYNLYRQFI